MFLTTDLHAAIVDTLETGQKEIIVGPIGTTPLEAELRQIGVDAETLQDLLPSVEFAELSTFNYGLVKVFAGDDARVEVEIKDTLGASLYELTIPKE